MERIALGGRLSDGMASHSRQHGEIQKAPHVVGCVLKSRMLLPLDNPSVVTMNGHEVEPRWDGFKEWMRERNARKEGSEGG